MSITSLSSHLGSYLAHDTAAMRDRMQNLERQLSTGQKADSYAGLGDRRRLSVSFRQTVSEISSWQESIKLVDMRINIADVALTRMADLRTDAKAAIDPNTFNLNGSGKTSDQQVSKLLLEEFHSLLKTDVGGRYIFGGRQIEVPPVADLDTILNGNGQQSGVKTYIDERMQADKGVNGLGRVTTPALAGTNVSFAGEAPATMPFGVKIEGISVDGTAMVPSFTSAAGAAPANLAVDFASQPNIGQEVRINFTLPNGKQEVLELRAGNLTGTNDATFLIGPTPADTAANFRDKLEEMLRLQADSSLEAASALQAAYEFFRTGDGQDPQRVAGPPFNTATSLTLGSSADTIEWYVGENNAESARTGAVTRVDREVSVSYGMRANEDSFAWMMAQMAAFAVEDFSAGTVADKSRHSKFAQMINQNMSDRPGNPLVEAVHAEITSAHLQAKRAEERHEITVNQYQNLSDDIEKISTEEVAVSILQLQTQLEASYSITSRLSQLSLVNFLR